MYTWNENAVNIMMSDTLKNYLLIHENLFIRYLHHKVYSDYLSFYSVLSPNDYLLDMSDLLVYVLPLLYRPTKLAGSM